MELAGRVTRRLELSFGEPANSSKGWSVLRIASHRVFTTATVRPFPAYLSKLKDWKVNAKASTKRKRSHSIRMDFQISYAMSAPR